MILTLATILTALAFSPNTDTTVVVGNGARLEVQNFGGAIEVRTWPRRAVRVEAEHGSRTRIDVSTAGQSVEVRSRTRHGIPAVVDYRITVPDWMQIELSGVNTDMRVEGLNADVSAETVQGDVFVRGGKGFIRVSSVQGSVDIDGARGRIEASSINNGVMLRDVDGEVAVEAVNGDVILDQIKAKLVEAETVNGDVTYLGTLLDQGRYRLASHQGDLILAVPDRTNAKVSIATFKGDFEVDFPINIERTERGKRFAFVLGSGSAVVDLESFAGTIRLERELKRIQALLQRQRERLEQERVERNSERVELRRVQREAQRKVREERRWHTDDDDDDR